MRHPLSRSRLLHGASILCLTLLGATNAHAQSASAVRAALGLPNIPANAIPMPGVPTNLGSVSLLRDQASASARQMATRQRLANSLGLVNQAQAAARMTAAMVAQTVPNGLVPRGLELASGLVPATQDPTGVHTLQNALAPTQSVKEGATTVTITQTDSRAIISWQTFNIGRDTTLVFDQKLNGVIQKDWVAFNRVVGQLDPATGLRDPKLAPAPSQIFGHIQADAQIIIANANGVFFSGSSQVRAGSLTIRSLDGAGSVVSRVSGPRIVRPATYAEANSAFLNLSNAIYAAANAGQIQVPDPIFGGGSLRTVAEPTIEGDVQIAVGADLAVGDAGTLLIEAPHIVNAGSLSAVNGSILLAAGRNIAIGSSSGSATDIPDVRGQYIRTAGSDASVGSYILNTGSISSVRGYVDLSTDTGAILQQGAISATTSVARNGFIDLGAADIRLAPGSIIAITPDEDGSTIPQSSDSVAAFKSSRVRIGQLAGSRVEVATNSLLYAPGARVSFGDETSRLARLFVDTGATIDVGGVKDLLVPASRNQITISPAKRNELRDTPNYRNGFLNGATIYVDPRRSGVRADGVAWVGSPLVEAGSYYQDVGITAGELLTKGGSVNIGAQTDAIIKPGATIDISGGFVRYAAGQVQTSQLITRGGQIVDIGNADPNGDYVGLVNAFTTTNTRFGVTDAFPNGTIQGVTQVAEYTEGRDAGALRITSPTIALDGAVYGQAFAGSLQRGGAARGTATSSIVGDVRTLQAVPSQLPSGGLLAINPVEANAPAAGDILVTTSSAIAAVPVTLAYGQSVSIADGTLSRVAMRDPASLLGTERTQTIELGDATLSTMGLGQLTLNTSGALTFAANTLTTLAPGGALTALDGRRVEIDGAISAPSGTIDISTFSIAGGQITAATPLSGSAFASGLPGVGAFDVIVNGTLSTRGRFVNDFGLAGDQADGGAYTAGGTISIYVAPRVGTTIGAPVNEVTDISGSILINPGALVDVSGGALVSATGVVNTSARGGSLSLYNDTTYAELAYDYTTRGPANLRGLRFSLDGPLPSAANIPQPVTPSDFAVNPRTLNARVTIAPGTVRAAGFAGGGAFNLTTPSFDFGTGPVADGTRLPLDFLTTSGFGSATIQVLQTSLFANRFVNTLGGYNALLSTNTITIGAGQTLVLSQSRYSRLLASDQTLALRAMPTGGDLASVLVPFVPTAAFDQLPIALTLTGLNELDVASGGSVVGAPGASITVAKLLDQGSIVIPDGTVTARERLPSIYLVTEPLSSGIGVHALSDVLTTRTNGDIVETDPNAVGARDPSSLAVFSNRDYALLHPIYLLGRLDQNEGIRIAPGGTIDLSGASLRNPRAVTPTGVPIIDGHLLDGGTLTSVARSLGGGGYFQIRLGSVFGALNSALSTTIAGDQLNALPGSTINLSGAADSYARLNAAGVYAPTAEWSNGGTLGLRAGGTLAGATIRAAGGAAQATGGTLIARDLVLRQTDPTGPTPASGTIAADQIAASGFDTVVAEGSLNSVGAVNLSLRRAFIVQSAPDDGAGNRGAVRVGAGDTLAISAPIIRFASVQQDIGQTAASIAAIAPGTARASFTASALDVEGAVFFDPSIAQATLQSAGDLRLIGVQPYVNVSGIGQSVANSLAGQLVTEGDLTLAAAQVYPTTGTSFVVASAVPTGTIRLARTTADAPATPYSAGTDLSLQAATIEQGGILRAPLGTLRLGANTPLVSATGLALAPATATLHLASGSLTSVSADGLSIPYGITTDQTEYFFTPTVAAPLTQPPGAVLRLGGANIALDTGATVNLKGGGDVYAYEFVPGVGGSRDVLDRLNSDQFSSRNGFQYPDARQVYAIVPGLQTAGLATVDPIYSGDYGALTSASQVGRRVYLNAAPGLAAGWYTLLPAKYALLPGGLRIVEQPEYGSAVPGQSAKLLDGTIVVGGYYGTAGTNLQESELRTFAVQTQTTFRNESSLAITSADTVFPARAARNGLVSPRIPLDAGRLVINAITGITANATFQTDAAIGGRASTADIGGSNFEIVGTAPAVPAPAGTIVITAGTLQRLNAASLLIGGTRTDNVDGTTSLAITGQSILLANDAASALSAPELLFAVDGSGSSILFNDGASVSATGPAGDTRTGNYVIAGSAAGQTGAGALVRLSTGPERLVTRTGVQTVAVAPSLGIGLAHLSANALLLDSSGDLTIASPTTGSADITATALAIGAQQISFTNGAVTSGLAVTPALQAAFARASTLNLRSAQGIGFASGTYTLGALTLDAPTLAYLGSDAGAVGLNTGSLRLANSATQALACTPDCGAGTLAINASAIAFGSGQIRTPGFGGGVTLSAPGGIVFDGADNTNAAANNGTAGLDAGSAPLALVTPFLGDRAIVLTPGQSAVLPRLALTTTGALTLTSGGASVPTVTGTPGARLALTGSDIAIADTQVVATAGTLDITATGAIRVSGAAKLATPGYARIFGDAADPVSQSAPGGLLRLTAGSGDITLGKSTLVSVGGGAGQSGELDLTATNGIVTALGAIDAKTPDGGGAFRLLSRGAFDLGQFVTNSAAGFDRSVEIRSGAGDLSLASGQSLVARHVGLTADAGTVNIAGTIDASGVNGGDIALYGANGVMLTSTGTLVARASGYGANDSRQAKGGDVAIGTDGAGTITLAAGSTIDVSATRPGDRLVTDVRAGTTYYRFAQGDLGGTLRVRAPLIAAASGNTVNVSAAGTVKGAREVSVEAFRRFDLAAIAASGSYSGVSDDGSTALLDAGASASSTFNFLADLAPGTIPDFVQNFSIAAAAPKLTGLGTYRARPGIELDYAGTVQIGTLTTTVDADGVTQTTASNWNLGAGTIDIAGATAAGDIGANPAQPGAVYIVPGREADVFQRFTRLTYRVLGKVDGEPGVLSVRAGGTLDIKGSITDGFFAFRDQTTPGAINYAFGGGNRAYTAVVQPDCADGACAAVIAFDPTVTITTNNAIAINFSAVGQGTETLIPISYNPDANSPSAPSGFPASSGDALGTAQVFPRLTTATGTRAVDSWTYRLVGGADLAGPSGAPSVNPLAVNPASKAGVIVEGETSYAVQPVAGSGAYVGNLQVLGDIALSGTGAPTDPSGFVAAFIAARTRAGVAIDTSSATLLTLAGPVGPGDPVSTFLVDRATSYFAAYPAQAVFGTAPDGSTTVSTRLDLAGGFVQSIAADYNALITSGAGGYAPPTVPSPTATPTFVTNYVRTRVRTGTGSIAVAAAGDIDTSNGPVVTRLTNAVNTSGAEVQVGGTSIYTAGALADLSARTVVDPAGIIRTLDPGVYAASGSIFAATATTALAPPVVDALLADPAYLGGGGDVALDAGGSVIGRRDVQGGYRLTQALADTSYVGRTDAPYRIASVDQVTDVRTNALLFQTGVGTLGGGRIHVAAGGNVSDLTVVQNTSIATAAVTGSGTATRALVTNGGGQVDVQAARDIVSGVLEVGAGSADVRAGRDVTTTGTLTFLGQGQPVLESNALRVRVTDADVALSAAGRASVSGVFAFGPRDFYTPVSGFSARSNGRFFFDYILYGSDRRDPSVNGSLSPSLPAGLQVISLPGSLQITSLTGDIDLTPRRDVRLSMVPSPIGQLQLFAGANIAPVSLGMSDTDPGLIPGYFSTVTYDPITGLVVGASSLQDAVLSTTSDSDRRRALNSTPTHANDPLPVRIVAGGDIDALRLNTPKQTWVQAGRDVLNTAVFAQNLAPSDISRVVAGRDLIATSVIGQRYSQLANGSRDYNGPALPIGQGNVFVIGGPGTFFVEAGRDAGPFLSSVVASALNGQGRETLGGGILSVGNDWNPWLRPVGASLIVQFGVGKGVNYAGVRDIYLDPANVAALPDDLFAQTIDQFGRSVADRTQPIYTPVLIAWAQANAAAELTAAYGTTDVSAAQAYAVFKALPVLRQRQLLIEGVYFNELRQTSIPTSVSYLKYSRGYRAVNTLFPPADGYTANDLSGGGGTGTVPIETGNLDLRLATIQTTRGGSIDILGPGGRVLGGSTVRTSAQAARRLTIAERIYDGFTTNRTVINDPSRAGPFPTSIDSIPTGLEGVITLRGGAVNGFVDQNFLLNQSRLFTEAGGDIALWSSNGDLNAGQGPKTSANFPPVVVRVGPNGNAEVDAVGGVTGAGIAAFQPAAGVPAPDVFLIAPRGTVDAGDAGVRVAGNLFVAAQSVANADNFSVGGSAFGIPAGPVVNTAAAAAGNAASAAAQQVASAAANANNRRQIDPLSRISVDVLGYYGSSDPCEQVPRPVNCPKKP